MWLVGQDYVKYPTDTKKKHTDWHECEELYQSSQCVIPHIFASVRRDQPRANNTRNSRIVNLSLIVVGPLFLGNVSDIFFSKALPDYVFEQ